MTSNNCFFCHLDSDREVILESELAFAIYDKFPVSPGHALIIPKKHFMDFFEMPFENQSACLHLLNQVKQIIMAKFDPEGFNVGINIGEAAGQTISHVHLHLIPRYMGDVENPRGGVRGVIPDKQEY